MPIRPDLKQYYGRDWARLSLELKEAAGWRCQGSPAYPDCRAEHGQPHPVTGSIVVLTVGHLDHDPTHNDPGNLAVWCQRCHNTYDLPHRQRHAWLTRARKKGQLVLSQLAARCYWKNPWKNREENTH